MDSTGKYNKSDWLKLRRKVLANKYHDTSQAYETIRGMLSTLDDPYTRFLDPKEFKELQIDTSGELTGIGIQISIDSNTKDIIVIAPIEGTPAFKAGIQPNDIIVSIDDTSTKGMGVEDVVKLIRGKKGTSVKIGILRGKKILVLSLLRDRISIRSVTSRLNKSNTGINIAYIRIRQFSSNSANELRNSLSSLKQNNPDAYIIDLRSNPGGLLEASIDMSRQLLDKGVIVSTKTKDGIRDVRRATGNALISKPLALLVNEASASASEIMSAAIQDNNRGILVGKKTFGKGLVQSVRPLVDGSGLTVTVAKYLTPKGIDIHKNGISPDIEASISKRNKTNISANQLGTSLDNQYSVAVSALSKLLSQKPKYKSFIPKIANYSMALEIPTSF
ncbi:Carboxyl-terminal protease [Prochlorococcus sp. MIT 0602]|nr:Carboxyl-terminal protease [Prochlorococcus sp. MIT 0602]KGG17617.1 Carboxyl-terminal protease [Prochlorococcus sp. MIT 0603]